MDPIQGIINWLKKLDARVGNLETGPGLPTWIRIGTGSPEGAVAAPVGSLFLRTNGGTSTTLYVKETGAATNTGWVAK